MQNLYYLDGSPYAVQRGGKREYFYPGGKIKTVEHYAEGGRLDGEVLLYWPNGILKRKCSFKRGVRVGPDQIWDEKGILRDEGSYDEGKPIGTHRRWGENGKLIEEIVYLEAGRFNLKNWDEKGSLRVDARWEGDQYHEKAWDRFQNIWIEKEGRWDGKKLVYV